MKANGKRKWKYPCQNHPDVIGWVDVGVKDNPIYLCRDCYLKLRRTNGKENLQEMQSGTCSGS